MQTTVEILGDVRLFTQGLKCLRNRRAHPALERKEGRTRHVSRAKRLPSSYIARGAWRCTRLFPRHRVRLGAKKENAYAMLKEVETRLVLHAVLPSGQRVRPN